MAELSKWDAVAVLTAMEKIVKERKGELRGECDREMAERYESDGITNRALRVAGQKVGDYTVVFSKPGFAVANRDEFTEFALAYGFASEVRRIRPEYMARAVEIVSEECPEAIETEVSVDSGWEKLMTRAGGGATYLDSGEPVPGVVYVPEAASGTRVTGCRPDVVAPLVRSLGGIDNLLLGGAR